MRRTAAGGQLIDVCFEPEQGSTISATPVPTTAMASSECDERHASGAEHRPLRGGVAGTKRALVGVVDGTTPR